MRRTTSGENHGI